MKVDYTLYLVTDRRLMRTQTLTEAVKQAILGGCTMVQLREKDSSSKVFLQQAQEVKRITDQYQVPLIINDRLDIALAVGAFGIHIGQNDLPVPVVRQIIGKDMLLGVSVSSVEEAGQAMEDGADYLGVGAMFTTGTKTDAGMVSMEELIRIRRITNLPIVVIGGINRENAGAFRPMGIDGLAVVSSIIGQSDIRKAAGEIKRHFIGRQTMKFKAAIFDLDGTLLNSMDVWKQIDISFLQKRGLPVPADYVTEICSRSFAEAAQYTIDLFKISEKVEDMVKEWEEMAVYEYAHNVELMPHTLEYILKLKDMGVKLAVATGLPEKLYLPCLENNGVLELFDVCCSTDEVKRGKEYPDIFAFAAQKLDVCPEQCLVFDDVLPAVRSAKQSGMLVCGVYDKYSAHHRTEMEQIADGYLIDFKDAPLPDCED